MKLRILHVADVDPSPDSGAAGTDLQGVLALERAGHSVRAIWGNELSHLIPHYNLRYIFELPLAIKSVVRREMSLANFDVVQVSQPHGYLVARDIHQAKCGPVFVHRSHGFEGRVLRDLERWYDVYPAARKRRFHFGSAVVSRLLEMNNAGIARYASGHLVSASECASYLRDTYSVQPERLAVVPQAVADTYLVDAAPVDPVRLERLLYVGQYAFFKAPMVLMEVIVKLLDLFPGMRFTWVCSKAHHSEIAGQIPSHLMNRVQLLDWMPQNELVRVYDEHGIFLFPSFFEGFGKAFLEAMSRGLVVVAADNGGMRDVIRDQIDGYKVPTGDIQAMVDCVSSVVRNVDMSLTISMSAIGTASKLTWDRYAEDSTGFYRRLIELDRVRRAARGG